MSPKHITHIIFSLNTGGAENLMIDMANGQSKRYKVSIIIVNNDYDNGLLQRINPSIKTILINRKKSSKNIYNFFILHKYLFLLKPDIVHCHNHNAITALLIYRKRTLLTIHDVGITIKNLHQYRRLVAISPAVYNDVVQRSNKTLQPTIINNAIAIETIQCRQDLQLHKPIRIIQISRLEHEKKGQDILLHAVAKLFKTNPAIPIKISFVGTGTSLTFLQKLTQTLALNNYVEFLMQKDRQWVYKNLCNYDILIQPSRYEGFGLTLLEAMAAKVPVIASNIDGPAMIINKEQYGYLFDNENSTNLALTIEKVINDYKSNIIEKKVLRSKERVEKEYSLPTLLSKYEELYATIS